MTEIIKRKTCDVCKREVAFFSGSLEFNYSDNYYTGCGYPIKIERKEICIECCRKLDKAIVKALKELKE